MTAEIAIANKSAVALAADSKVTVGGSRGMKTYDTVNKVFTLSKAHPVGIMIFGNAEFMDYPWETIIKLYRRERGYASRNYIASWSDDFQKYLEGFGRIEVEHKSDNIYRIVSSWLNDVEDVAYAQAQERSVPVPSEDYVNILKDELAKRTANLSSQTIWLPKSKSESFVKKYAEAIARAVLECFGAIEDDELMSSALAFSVQSLVKNGDSPQSSGFVLAGFGDKELFPTFIEHNTDGYVGDQIKLRRDATADICRSMPAYIRAFAQKDMVQRFMNGVDPQLGLMMNGMFNQALQDSCLAVLEAHGTKRKQTDKVRNEIMEATRKRMGHLWKDFAEAANAQFSGPVIHMVSLLPKDELAHLAESLVALTSLKRRVSRDAETVGGPIDVALISKGDGFVWIKRKHYFKTELNPQFVRTYMDDTRARARANGEEDAAQHPSRSVKARPPKDRSRPRRPTPDKRRDGAV